MKSSSQSYSNPEMCPNIPEFLGNATRYDVFTDEGYDRLYRRLTAQPRYPKRPLGKVRHLPPHAPAKETAPARAKARGDRALTSTLDSPRTRASKAREPEKKRRGELVLIGRDPKNPQFLTAISIEAGPSITMVLAPASGDERAFLEELARRSYDPVSIAYGLTATRARVMSVKHVREAGEERHHVVFAPDEREYGSGITEMSTEGYSS